MTYAESPLLQCDIIMKGGITSGVIYPRAVCELAKTYRLRSVGSRTRPHRRRIRASRGATGRHHRDIAGRRVGPFPALPTDETDVCPVPGVHRRNGQIGQ